MHSDTTETTTRGNIITEMASDFSYFNQISTDIVRNCSRVDVCVVQHCKLNLRAQYIHAYVHKQRYTYVHLITSALLINDIKAQ
jgi:hypothetical protein